MVRSTMPVRPPWAFIQSELLGHQEQGGDRRGVVGLVLGRVVDRGRQVEERRHVAVGRGDLLDPGQRARRHDRDPQAAVGGEALLRREVVGVDLGQVDRQAAGAGGGVDQHQRRRRPAPRGVRPAPSRRSRSRCAPTRRRRRRPRRPGPGRVPGSLVITDGSASQGAFCRRAVANLRGELAEGQVLAPLADQPEAGDVPERRRAAVAEHDLVALGQRRRARRARRAPGRRCP